MQIIESDLWLCQCCLFASVNGDMCDCEGFPHDHHVDVAQGLAELGPHLVPDFDSESGEGIRDFSSRTCACCGTWLGGYRHRFAVLGTEKEGSQ